MHGRAGCIVVRTLLRDAIDGERSLACDLVRVGGTVGHIPRARLTLRHVDAVARAGVLAECASCVDYVLGRHVGINALHGARADNQRIEAAIGNVELHPAVALLREFRTGDGLVEDEVVGILNDTAFRTLHHHGRTLRDGSRCAQLTTVLHHELLIARDNTAEVAHGLIGVRKRGDNDGTTSDACATRVSVVGLDGQVTRAALHKNGVAHDGTRSAEGVSLRGVDDDGVGLELARQRHAELLGIVGEEYLVTADEDIAVLAVGGEEVLGDAEIPGVAGRTIPNNGACIAHACHLKIELAVLDEELRLMGVAQARNLHVTEVALNRSNLTQQIATFSQVGIGA